MSKKINTVQANHLFESQAKTNVIATGRDFEYDTCTNEFQFKQCSETGLIFLDPRPADTELNTIYPPDYLPYRFNELPPMVRYARDLVQRGKVKAIQKIVGKEAKILDFGCGNGSLLRLLKRYGSSSWELHGNDLNEESLKHLSQEGIIVHPCEIEKINLDQFFDIIILNQVIEHLGDIRGMLQVIRDLLKPGGFIFIETPSFDGFDAHIFKKGYWGGYHIPRHWYIFNAKLLNRLLNEMEFEVVGEEYLTSPSFWVQSFHHLLLDKGYSWLSKFFQASNPLIMAMFTLLDIITIKLGGCTSNLRIIGKKL